MSIRVRSKPAVDAVADLAEFEIHETQSITERDFSIGMIARFSEGDIYDEKTGRTYLVRFKKAFAQLHPKNCVVPQVGRAGDFDRITRRSTKSTAEATSRMETSVGTRLGVSADISTNGSPKASLGGGVDTASATSIEHAVLKTVEFEEHHSNIVHETALRWRIQELDDGCLTGKHAPPDHLCYIEPTADRGSVEGRLFVLPKHIDFDVVAGAALLSKLLRPNAKAIVGALIAKGLRSGADIKYPDGRIYLSESEVEFERPSGD